MTTKFNCGHTGRQPRKRQVCEWCAVEWRVRLDEIAELVKAIRSYSMLTGVKTPPQVERIKYLARM